MRTSDYKADLSNAITVAGKDPLSEIEKLAQEALTEHIITDREYLIVRHRAPFHGDEFKTFPQLRPQLNNVSTRRIRQLEEKAYRRMREYFVIKNLIHYDLDTTVDMLPWKGYRGVRAQSSLHAIFGKVPTIGEVIDRFQGYEKRGSTVNLGLGPLGIRTIYEVFERTGFPLPTVNFR